MMMKAKTKFPSQLYRKSQRKLTKKCARWGRRLLFAGILLLVLQVVRSVYAEPDLSTFSESNPGNAHQSRKLMSEGPVWERCDFEQRTSPYAFLPLYIFCIFLLFVAIAIICDDFFVPSLEAISERLDLSEDVAGATFMAAGSSAPELFTSVVGVGVDSDVGIGTIVGSATFNILVIIALSAVLAGKVLHLDWRPLTRDAVVYCISVSLFIGFSWDGMFTWYESLILLMIYFAYIGIMKVNPHLMKLLACVECWWCRNDSRVEPTSEEHGSENGSESAHSSSKAGGGTPTLTDGHDHHPSAHSLHHDEHKHRFVHSHRGELAGSFANRRRSSTIHHLPHLGSLTAHHSGSLAAHHSGSLTAHHSSHTSTINEEASSHLGQEGLQMVQSAASNNTALSVQPSENGSHGSQMSQIEEEEASMVLIPCFPAIRAAPPDIELAREEGKLGWVKFVFKWILFVLSFPFVVVFTWTIPNCSENRKWYRVAGSFLMSILWIAIISFAMVTIVARVGCILNVGEFTMGLVVVAIGTSVPDALSSILVARDGFGDMAVSNAIGSNVFDINLGLGLPFLISVCIQKGRPFDLLSEEQRIAYDHGEYAIIPHVKFGFILLLLLFVVLAILTLFRFRLNKITGVCLVFIYVVFLAYAFVQELVCDNGKHC